MDLGLKNKKALVTGSSKGLGLAVALGLAQEGAQVALCARSADGLEAAAAKIKDQTGQRPVLVPADLTVSGAPAEVVGRAAQEMGGLDVLVTNAGGPPAGQFEQFGEEDWLKAFRLNCLSALGLIKAALPLMKDQNWGRVINLTSISVKEPVPNLILSNGIRAGLVGAAKTISQDYGRLGITVNNIATGWTKTERVLDLAQAKTAGTDQSPDDFLASVAKTIPLGRMNEPQEVASLVVFLASEPARAITGTTIAVDGGSCAGLL
ncbi:MAG: SDR family oxidoreductase [Deltaproteobacteria bacterium]|nr:SDR family oxidoreductase [Deltaproteobacteria bacterium]